MGFSSAEQHIMTRLAEAVLPEGKLLPAASAQTVKKAIDGFDALPPGVGSGYRGMLWTLELSTLPRKRARFSTLTLGERLEALETFEAGDAQRVFLRGLLLPLKLAHFEDPALWKALGCRWSVEPPRTLERNRWREQVSPAFDFPEGEPLECEVVVVGTGAGGAPVAQALAEKGHAVLLLEEGEHHTRQDFNGRPMEMMRKLYRRAGLTASVGNTVIPIPIGKGVGGTTTINSGTCFRTPEYVLRNWRDEHGLPSMSEAELDPYFSQVEKFLEIGPSSKRALGKPAELIAKGCDALGWKHAPLNRNAPGCDGQGLCCFGCPTDAKRSTNVSFVPKALENGAQLLTGFEVTKVLVEDERAVGVEGLAKRDGVTKKLTVRAKAVVLACGSLLTPVLLQKNGLANSSGEVGKNLSIHPASSAYGVFEERLDSSRTVPQGYGIDQFHDEGILFEGGHTPLDLTAAAVPTFGPQFVSMMERYEHTIGFGFLVKDTSRGRVRVGPDGGPLISYWLNQHDLKKMQRGLGLLARMFFAAGAQEVWPTMSRFPRLQSISDVERLESASITAREIDITAYHPLGSCRMGKDPLKSVVNERHETHDVHNLFICDGSALPSSLGVNPQVTIMALALRAAQHIHARLESLSHRERLRSAS
ncbi:MAG: GMC family oxidoreductase [Myxococcaceae bacterium]